MSDESVEPTIQNTYRSSPSDFVLTFCGALVVLVLIAAQIR